MDFVVNCLMKGFTYNGNIEDCIINYLMLFVSIIPFLFNNSCNKQISPSNKWGIIFVLSWILQIMLWFKINCVGISVVWNIMFGLILISIKINNVERKQKMYKITIGNLFVADIYYLIKLGIISTIAHVISIIIGIFSGFIIYKINKSDEVNDGPTNSHKTNNSEILNP